MSVFRLIVFVGALAGSLAGLSHGLLALFVTAPLIHQAETYESAQPAHEHAQATPEHTHDGEEWQPTDGFERSALTVLAAVLNGIGFTILLTAAGELRGGFASWRDGALWGLAGFATFTLAPGLGLPPELPAMPAAALELRQVWWIATAICTAAGLASIVYGRGILWGIGGIVLFVTPHLIGAPQPLDHGSPIPEALQYQFVNASFATNMIFWFVAGVTCSLVRPRFMEVKSLGNPLPA